MTFPQTYTGFLKWWLAFAVPGSGALALWAPEWLMLLGIATSVALLAGGLQTVADVKLERAAER
jgi:hypothetical protein